MFFLNIPTLEQAATEERDSRYRGHAKNILDYLIRYVDIEAVEFTPADTAQAFYLEVFLGVSEHVLEVVRFFFDEAGPFRIEDEEHIIDITITFYVDRENHGLINWWFYENRYEIEIYAEPSIYKEAFGLDKTENVFEDILELLVALGSIDIYKKIFRNYKIQYMLIHELIHMLDHIRRGYELTPKRRYESEEEQLDTIFDYPEEFNAYYQGALSYFEEKYLTDADAIEQLKQTLKSKNGFPDFYKMFMQCFSATIRKNIEKQKDVKKRMMKRLYNFYIDLKQKLL